MKITITSVLILLATASEISAGLISSRQDHSHNMLARRLTRQKRCIARQDPSGDPPSSAAAPPEPSPVQNNVQENHNDDNNSGGGGGGGGGSAPGTIQVSNAPCGDPGASSHPTADNGPNGHASWLTCHITTTGWEPPPIYRENVKYIDLASATGDGGIFNRCRDYLDIFNHWGGQTGIPPILLASIALQESGCRHWVRGGNGEYGLMQITGEKCPVQDDSCLDPWTNVAAGASFFSRTVDSEGGNLAVALAMYNGWYRGLTEWAANDRAYCTQRNNLDYLHTILNGYMQGVDPQAEPRMGIFFNLDACGH